LNNTVVHISNNVAQTENNINFGNNNQNKPTFLRQKGLFMISEKYEHENYDSNNNGNKKNDRDNVNNNDNNDNSSLSDVEVLYEGENGTTIEGIPPIININNNKSDHGHLSNEHQESNKVTSPTDSSNVMHNLDAPPTTGYALPRPGTLSNESSNGIMTPNLQNNDSNNMTNSSFPLPSIVHLTIEDILLLNNEEIEKI